MSQLTRAGGRFELALNTGWHIWVFTAGAWLIGFLLYLLQTPVVVWGGLWALFFLYAGSYCVRNFLHCRETHCAITGPGWILIGIVAVFGIIDLVHIPQWALLWVAYLLVAGVGFGLQWLVARRTGRQSLGDGPASRQAA
jgi:hypothetical protein